MIFFMGDTDEPNSFSSVLATLTLELRQFKMCVFVFIDNIFVIRTESQEFVWADNSGDRITGTRITHSRASF